MNKNKILVALFVSLFFGCTKTVKEYYPDGSLKQVYKLKNEEIHGEYHLYYDNDTIKEVSLYDYGLKNGISKIYFENGNIHYYNIYREDTLIFQKLYNDKGELVSEDWLVEYSLEKDTVKIGEKVKASIKINGPKTFDYAVLYISWLEPQDDEYLVTDEIIIDSIREMEYEYTKTLDEPGLKVLGVRVDINQKIYLHQGRDIIVEPR